MFQPSMSDGDDLELELPPLELQVQRQADGLELQALVLELRPQS